MRQVGAQRTSVICMLFKDLWWLIRRYWLAILLAALIVSQIAIWYELITVRDRFDHYVVWRAIHYPD